MAAVLEVELPSENTLEERFSRLLRYRYAMLAHVSALLLFTVLTLTRSWTLVTHPASTVTPHLLDPVYNIWGVASAIHSVFAWRHGLWSFFDANIFYPTPHPAAYRDIFVGLLPLSAPLSIVIPNPVVLTNLLLGLSFILSAYGAFALGYRLTGSYVGALVCGITYGFCPLRTEQIDHLSVISTEWQIAAAYSLVRVWQSDRRRWWALSGLFGGLAVVMHLYYLAYLSIPLLVIALLLGRAWTPSRRRGATLAAIVAATLILPSLIPYATRHATSTAQYGAAGSMDVFSFLQVLPGRPIDSKLLPTVPLEMLQPNHGLFPGFVALILAVVAWRRRRARLWGVFAMSCGLLSLGPYLNVHGHVLSLPLPYAWLSAAAPPFQLFRDPTRAAMGLYLGLAVLASWGATEALHSVRLPRRRTVLGAALVAVSALELWSPLPVVVLPAIPAAERWLAAQPRIHTVAELPIANRSVVDWQRQLQIMYDSTAHWKMLVNGAGSVDPTGMAERRATLATYPSPASIWLLDTLRVDALVLRRPWLTPGQWRAAMSRCNVAFQDAVETICRGPWL